MTATHHRMCKFSASDSHFHLKMPSELIFEPFAATHQALFLISLGLECPNASLKLFAFMQVIAAPMSNSQLNVFVPVVTLI
jgi:hypothetical protein